MTQDFDYEQREENVYSSEITMNVMDFKYWIAFFRSCVFWVFAFFTVIFVFIFQAPLCFLFGKKYLNIGPRALLFWLRTICGLSIKIEGVIPNERVIFAVRHYSDLECLIFSAILDYPKFVLKKAILENDIVLRFYFKFSEFILIDRDDKAKSITQAMSDLPKAVKKAIVEEERQVVIFPEGGHVPYGAKAKSMGGINFIQKINDFAEICPVVHDSGKFPTFTSFIKYPGVITMKFLPLISRNESFKTFNKTLDKVFDENEI
jgi:1-acyl-sn-glycerol-3-phosphate acyltransferase